MGERALRLIFWDQLSLTLPTLGDGGPDDVILLAETYDDATYVRHHKKKLVFLLASLRHFAGALANQGYAVRHVRLDDPHNSGSHRGEVLRALKNDGPFDRVILTEPSEWRLHQDIQDWSDAFSKPVEVLRDDRFLASHEDFSNWAADRKSLRMEYFYREMRKRYDILMDGDTPVGDQWNYDAANRKALDADYQPPERLRFPLDTVTRDVMDLVAQRFGNNFGDLDGFDWAVTTKDARRALDHFVDECLPSFGDYQDAMARGEAFLSHSLVSFYINNGLLDPLEVCRAAEAAFEEDRAPLNAVEGFIRQILGWREYVRGIYWLKMPEYKELNYFNADRPLPDFFWTGSTDMECLAQVIGQTNEHAYAHHIQRLMVTGNFAMLMGAAPDEINDWYMVVYGDAHEWVELPNVHGMATFADGGVMASKPYAASGAYINRMSNYCGSCRYSVTKKNGPDACPFNYLYWDFLMRHENKLRKNPRIGRIYGTLDRMSDERKQAIGNDTRRFLREVGVDRSANSHKEPAQ